MVGSLAKLDQFTCHPLFNVSIITPCFSSGLANERYILIYLSIDGKEYTIVMKHVCYNGGHGVYVVSNC